ncbi:MAG: alpha-amylase family glycosyl hydrolase [Bacteroidota bacterium]
MPYCKVRPGSTSVALLLGAMFLAIMACRPEIPKETPMDDSARLGQVPQWSKETIWYQIYVERFRNGDPTNDPRPEDIVEGYPGFVPKSWAITPWGHDWYKEDPYFEEARGKLDLAGDKMGHFNQMSRLRRYGGDLQGVLDKVDYLDSLGINAVYFNPLNDAPTDHKFDARNWRHIDRNFGPDPEGDIRLMAKETPDDPTTWVMTGADSLFLKVVDKLHKKGIRVIMDYSWNHTGVSFWAWKDLVRNQQESKYKDWYWVEQFDDPNTTENEFEYHGWFGVKDLVQIKETEYVEHKGGSYIFDGNLASGTVKQHMFNVAKKWLDPNGDGNPSDGIDGFRLDVCAELPLGFWREFRKAVRGVNPEAYLVGETWFEVYPNSMMDPEPMLRGDVFDAVMNYRWFKAARELVTGQIGSRAFADSIARITDNLALDHNFAMMNVAASHDTPRLTTSLYNRDARYKYQVSPTEEVDYKIDSPDAEALQSTKLFLAHQFTYVGAPQIWAGDEMGMWGADMGDTRKPLIWPDYDFEPESVHPVGRKREPDPVVFNQELFQYYRKLIALRKAHPVLNTGRIQFLELDGMPDVVAYKRFLDDEAILVILNLATEPRSVPMESQFRGKDYLGNAKMVKKEDRKIAQLPARSAALFSNQYLDK